MKASLKDIDGKVYYTKNIDPLAVFNKLEITLSHLFRKKIGVLGNRTYSDCLFQFLERKGYLRPTIVEVGCGLGDIALNLLGASGESFSEVDKYIMVDISPRLLEVQRQRLGDLVWEYILADCFELSRVLEPIDGMVLSNAMIADLRSTLLSPRQPLSEYGIQDAELDEFAAEWMADHGGCYIHVGAILFLRQIHQVLKAGSTAVILEYASSNINQPSLFYDEETGEAHTKCGIDFAQIAAYARRMGFAAEVTCIEEIFGIRPDQEFLTVDVFVRPDKLAQEVPVGQPLLKLMDNLPVLAYTRESLREALVSDPMSLSQSEADQLMGGLERCFYSIHDPRFDSTNPTTWGYQCLLLRK